MNKSRYLIRMINIFFHKQIIVMFIECDTFCDHYLHNEFVQTFIIVLELIIAICSNHNELVQTMVLQVVEE